MIGVVLTVPPDEVKHAAIDQGLLVLTAGEDVLRLLPPLVISDADIDEGLARLKSSLDQAGREKAANK